MARRRFFVPAVRNGAAEISGEDARHLTQVLRVEAGQIFEISDNEAVYLAEISTVAKSRVVFQVMHRQPDPPPSAPVHLIAALIKFDRLEMLLEKATELGVTSVRFVRAERSDKGLDKAAEKRIERWRRIVTEASQQSRRLRVPELFETVRFKDGLAVEAGRRLFLDEERTGVPLLDASAGGESIAVLVGPEGGWVAHEREEAHAAGWTSVTLGENILRAETAAVAALAVVNAVLRR
jgi:16S rRNA (uracil1498-N3)-methyltransferase